VRGLNRWHTFSGGLLFAASAAAGVFPWLLVAAPIVGRFAALALYLVATLAAYLAAIAPDRPRGVRVATAAVVAGLAFAASASSIAVLAVTLAAVLAVGRSVFLYVRSPARAVLVEAALFAGGLSFARFLAGGPVFAVALAVWGFFLVQSLYFLVTDARPRTIARRHPDPFEDAHARALALLDDRLA
jgi:hypothetical protein